MLISQKIQKLPPLSGKHTNRRRLWRHLKNRPNRLDGLVADFQTTDFVPQHRRESVARYGRAAKGALNVGAIADKSVKRLSSKSLT
jgi:hypothetical protein